VLKKIFMRNGEEFLQMEGSQKMFSSGGGKIKFPLGNIANHNLNNFQENSRAKL